MQQSVAAIEQRLALASDDTYLLCGDMIESQFSDLAPFYDELMIGVPYRLWANYIQDLFRRYKVQPKSILDVACGTGNVSETLADRGYDVTGVDLSDEMIKIAKTKSGRVDYYTQGIAQINLDRRYDAAVSLFDSLNYVLDPAELALGMCKVNQHIEDNGLFIFDVNTIYALENHFFDRGCMGKDSFPRYMWTSEYDHSTAICKVDMTFEVLSEAGILRFEEVHRQRGYTLEELSGMMVDAGFELLDIFTAYKFKKPTRRSDRVFFIGRKINKC